MSGHSQFKNIMYRKGAQDAKRSKIFSKISREITVAVKSAGTDPETNSKLRTALLSARAENMPKDNIERAIKKASGLDGSADYHEIRYEGYGPGGVAIIVEALTDNKNRTAPDVRSAFTKFGGNLGELNSVAFQFEKIGCIGYKKSVADENAIWELALDSGAEDIDVSDDGYQINTTLENFSYVRDFFIEKFGDPEFAKIIWSPLNTTKIDDKSAISLSKLIDVLEDNDDIQTVTTNLEP